MHHNENTAFHSLEEGAECLQSQETDESIISIWGTGIFVEPPLVSMMFCVLEAQCY